MNEELKVYIVIRKDLKMRRGKEVAQACHAIQYLCDIGDILLKEGIDNGSKYSEWCKSQHAKIAVGVNSEVELWDLMDKASSMDVMHASVLDAGRTEIPENTLTCFAFGPVTNAEADELGLSALPLR